MLVNERFLWKMWGVTVCFTVLLVSLVLSSVKTIYAEKPEDPDIIMTVVEKTVEVVTVEEVPITEYLFPFDVEYMGNYPVEVVGSSTGLIKEYPEMRSYDGVTVFSSKSVCEDGTMVWLEGFGIYQVQTIYTDFEGFIVYMPRDYDMGVCSTREIYEVVSDEG